ncbi:DUF1471 domain-containing protein [Scandinavium goeteborgense]|uniref:DUF1471 domain-containing protein n=1 Tax=Scandinavium goeteborgense TaxID=1851514 RepID=UPI0021651CDF|nr:DUF1471 domain-containing protein [Scandinavium goeteborgense]MCS2151238.1 DUF1471 domain-containing protein [Scandinavium goeteborgense]
MKLSYMISLLLLTISTGAFAAKEIRYSEMADMANVAGSISVNIKNGTLSEAEHALAEKAEKQGAKYYRVTSIGMSGMGSDVRATAVIYK